MAYKVECVECDKKESFMDMKDITYSKWKIIAWMLPSGDPRVVCPNCEYKLPSALSESLVSSKNKTEEN